MAARSRSVRRGAGGGGPRWRRAAAARRSEGGRSPMATPGQAPAAALRAVLKPSGPLPGESLPVRGYDFAGGPDHAALLRSFRTTGFQATSFAQAVAEIHRMIAAKLEPLSEEERGRAGLAGPRPPSGCTIFLGFTSNLISSGVRETIRYLVQRNMVDVLVTTAGGVEEDLIKCLAPTYIGDFSLRGQDLRQSGINRIGNLLVPNDNYCKFEDWLMPILEQMVDEQETQGVRWTPSRMIARLGKEINNPESVCYWAQKNNIPVLSPALTDGSLGDMIFFHSYKHPGLVLDIVEDLRLINTQAIFARKTGMIILGGGLVKHHIANANLMRNGADFSVYVNTAQEFDGSDSGARPDEAVSWGKIRMDATPVKVYADASLVFPLLVAETFAQRADAFPSEMPAD
ncbi:deoxyhypusine synthase isoform X1 [Accipiter gentilis]|uniref:deoxyhypusine synthase isoform X1 n=2 Tax=Astur gentilis TaxID=8957 RepID=UPI00210FCB60|nr:deoxyhypusine synthase isoform X1 [Accipiter gentilis]